MNESRYYKKLKDRQEILWKKLDEKIKVIADVQRSIFAAFLATVLATINSSSRFAVGIGVVFSVVLLILLVVLTVVRQRKTRKYE